MTIDVCFLLTGTSYRQKVELTSNSANGKASLFDLFCYLKEVLPSAAGSFVKDILSQRQTLPPYVLMVDGRVVSDLDEVLLSDGSQVLVIPLLEGG